MMKKFLMLFGIFVTCAALAEGFPSGTIVHCPFEDVPIEYIKQGTPVFSFDSDGSHCIERVLKIFEKDTDTLIRLQAEGENFFAAPDQLFLLSDNTWRAAVDLQVGDGLRRVGGVSSVIDLEIIDVSGTHAQLYTLFISGTQNFSITKCGFYVHNVVPAVIVVAGVVVKSTLAVVLEAAAEVAAVAGIGYGGAYLNSKYKERQTRRPRDLSAEDMVREKIFVDEYNKQHCKQLEDLYDPTKYTKQPDGTYISVSDDTCWGRIFGQRLKPEDFHLSTTSVGGESTFCDGGGQSFKNTSDGQLPTNPGGKKATSSCGGGGGRPPDDPNDPRWKNVFKSAPKPDNKEVQRQVRQLQKSRRSLEKVAKEHMEKLAAYKKNPYACDNLGHLKNAATPERAENIIRTRIRLLTGEIAGFEKDIIQIDRDLADLGSP